jgi:hypothetical protein
MLTSPEDDNADQLGDISKESVRKLHTLVEDLKSVEEHENTILTDDPPLFGRSGPG